MTPLIYYMKDKLRAILLCCLRHYYVKSIENLNYILTKKSVLS